MRRIPVLLGTFALCGLLIGCGGDSRDYLVTQTVSLMNEAATATTGITESVNTAVKASGKVRDKLDLTEAVKATDALRDTGKKLQEMKQRTENLRGTISEEERSENADEYRNKIVASLQELTKAKDALQVALAEAEKLNRKEAEKLRVKIREAEGPFEAVARQQ